MPQRIALFARKSAVAAPAKLARGFFYGRRVLMYMQVVAQRKVLNRAIFSAAALFFYSAGLHAQASTAPPATPLYREVTDETGRTIHIPQDVRRIVSLAPSLTETIYALGLQDRLVGDTNDCDYPPEARQNTKAGGGPHPRPAQSADVAHD